MTALVVGLGAIGQRHVRNLRARGGDAIDIVALRTRGLSHTLTDSLAVDDDRDVHDVYDLRRCASLEEAVANRPDVAFVCNPTSAHVTVAMALADAGCHLLIEKPLSDSLDGLTDLATLVEQRGRIAMVGYQFRFHPSLQAAARWLADDRLGPLIAATVEVGEHLPSWHPYEDYRESYAARRALGGGAILTQSHELDYIGWLLGPPTRVAAFGGRVSDLEIDVEDSVTLLMECTVSGRTVPVTLHQDYLQRPARRTCEVVGERGRLAVDLLAHTAVLSDVDGRTVARVDPAGFSRNQMFVDELDHLFACIRGDDTPRVGLRDGATTVRVALAARRALDTGAVVPVTHG